MINAIISLLGIAGIAMLAVVNRLTEKQNRILFGVLEETRKQNTLLENQLKTMFEVNEKMRVANENYSREIKAREAIKFIKGEQKRFVKENIAKQSEEMKEK